MCDCCQQAKTTEHARVEQLLDILERKPDTDLPKFCGALKEKRQFHILDILKKKGLNARAAILILSQHENRDICLARSLLVFAPNCQRLYNIFSQVCIFLLKLLKICELMQQQSQFSISLLNSLTYLTDRMFQHCKAHVANIA